MGNTLLVVLAGCSGGADDGFDKAKMLRATVDEVLLPAHAALLTSATDLDGAAITFCADPTEASLEAARTAWLATKVPLKQIEAWSFGPYRFADVELSKNVDKWPGRGEAVEAAITAAPATIDVAYVESLDYIERLKGYPAIGYLLWSDADPAATVARFDERRCAYLTATTAHAASYVQAYVTAWDSGGYGEELATAGTGSAAYPDDQAAITAIVGGMLTGLDGIATMKLGVPLGASSGGTPQPAEVESPHAGTSLADCAAVLDGVEAVYSGPEASLASYVRSRSAEGDVDGRVQTALADARTALGAVPEPLESAVEADAASVQAAIDAVVAVSVVVNGDVSTLLGVNPTTVDGDND